MTFFFELNMCLLFKFEREVRIDVE